MTTLGAGKRKARGKAEGKGEAGMARGLTVPKDAQSVNSDLLKEG